MEKKKELLEYQTPTVKAVLVFDDVYTGEVFEASQDVGGEYPWD